ncbi:uncharacterized protein MYCFIDRAFT_212251 [Pseudocercospora fijiensis CIRAD86]|uniref:6-methylsalicylate decarboxylase n=1 Tax=Pseudocercospora fijiensis (strain CIRAD86) TaxID=383855 RepID=M3A4L8_PSEFD|nr:uncharacterized protein MYCFIDRAFT_212251 [Pseudocercospora fijiensis CIRAD86]EME79551.1 hypothetical protein MYCFIDRAFT_212251 [Pseudocercospora fijiensis CIRAD86]
MPYLPDWDEEEHLTMMKNNKISKSILSISSPGCHLVPGNDSLARNLAREVNSFASDLKKRRPDRFGYFAALPLPDVQGCLEEIEKSVEEGCDGFVMFTNHHGHYLGDKEFDAVFDELNRRKALVFIHPTTPHCPCSSEEIAAGQQPMKATPFQGKLPNPWLEFTFDTARVVTNLFLSGTVQRCPNLRIVLSHLGGAFTPLLSRWTGYSEMLPGPTWQSVSEEVVKEAFKKQIWFDMAGFPFPSQLKGLVEGVGVSHTRLMYGSDYPFTRIKLVEILIGQMDEGVKKMFSEEQIKDLYQGNAEKLLACK